MPVTESAVRPSAFLQITGYLLLLVSLVFTAAPVSAVEPLACDETKQIYFTKGVHNPCDCGREGCVESRKDGDPPDPVYPDYWVSEWTMYRVFAAFEDNLPPWSNPPGGLVAGKDYEISYGATYYDATWIAQDGSTGAMMEHYERRCLPIFPIGNDFTCSFISLGNTAYFLTYQKDRPQNMPPCCLFSPYNHPPRRDFVKHLPYSTEDSAHLNGRLRAYRYVAPHDIWFAYAFFKDRWVDEAKQYLLPHSFYFSGYPLTPPNAPFVSQNYSNFRMEQPNPRETWAQVARMCPTIPPTCQLFDPPKPNAAVMTRDPSVTDWRRIDKEKRQ